MGLASQTLFWSQSDMGLSISSIEGIAPDQASLKAATKLLTPAKWPEREISADGALIWGACQGSGANPYRMVVDLSDLGAKCSCPSRKFPCKHALALMMQFSTQPADFRAGSVPEWVTDWLGRRRKTTAPDKKDQPAKSLAAAQADAVEAPKDPKVIARNAAAAAKRAQNTQSTIADGLMEMEAWISDQLRTGLSELMADMTARCRRIASRLVDAKAGSMAGRIDGIPSRVLALEQEDQADALIAELGKLVILSRAWGDGSAAAPAVKRAITSAESRETLFEDASAPRHTGRWEVLCSRDETRRDGLIARATWLLGLDATGPRFALLQDFFPTSLGKQGAAFVAGEQFEAEMVFFPAAFPLRAHLGERAAVEGQMPWPEMPAQTDVLGDFSRALQLEPWITEWPILLPAGRLAQSGDALFWSGPDAVLPMSSETLCDVAKGVQLKQTVALWNGFRADFLAADTDLGRYHANAG